jgi:transcriptional regulator with XRE-family HTH domain
MLGVSRPTLVQIEADKRKVKAEEIKKLSEIFDISTDYLLGIDTSEEVHIDEKQITKFKHLMLYILSKVGAKYNVGKVVLYKLLYFSEFDFYEQYQKKLAGYPFIKLPL